MAPPHTGSSARENTQTLYLSQIVRPSRDERRSARAESAETSASSPLTAEVRWSGAWPLGRTVWHGRGVSRLPRRSFQESWLSLAISAGTLATTEASTGFHPSTPAFRVRSGACFAPRAGARSSADETRGSRPEEERARRDPDARFRAEAGRRRRTGESHETARDLRRYSLASGGAPSTRTTSSPSTSSIRPNSPRPSPI